MSESKPEEPKPEEPKPVVAKKLTSTKPKNPARVEAGKLLGKTSAEARKRNIRTEHLSELREAGLLTDSFTPGDFSYANLLYVLGAVGVVAVGGFVAWRYKGSPKRAPNPPREEEDEPSVPVSVTIPNVQTIYKPVRLADLCK